MLALIVLAAYFSLLVHPGLDSLLLSEFLKCFSIFLNETFKIF